MATKRKQVVVDEIITGPCPECKVHSGVVKSVESVCAKLEEKEQRLSEKIDEREKISNLRFDGIKESIAVAKQVMDARLENMNHLTTQLNDQKTETREKLAEQSNTFLTKDKFDALHETLQSKLDSKIELFTKDIGALQTAQAQKKEGLRWMEYLITIIISFLVFILAHALVKF